MKIAIIGGGSAGIRHKRILEYLGHEVSLVSKHRPKSKNVFAEIDDLKALSVFDFIIVSNETNKHEEAIVSIKERKFRGILLVEKPLNSSLELVAYSQFKDSFVGFNLRFHPGIIRLKKLVDSLPHEIVSVEMYYGNSTNNWRPDVLSHDSYSKSVTRGGGVLRDFCHEIDLAHWLFGYRRVDYANGTKVSDFMVDGEDLVNIVLGGAKKFKVLIHLNSLQKTPNRSITIRTTEIEYKLDLVNSTLKYRDKTEKFELGTDYSYQKMHEAIISEDKSKLASMKDGKVVDNIIKDVEALYKVSL